MQNVTIQPSDDLMKALQETQKVTMQPSDDLMKALQEERIRRKTENIPDTITAILKDYFKMPKTTITITPSERNGIIQKWQKIRKDKGITLIQNASQQSMESY